MLTMTFKKFFKTDWDEGQHELYALKRGSEYLYIGIARSGIWNRWFGSRGHMPRNLWGQFFPGSPAGRAVIENFPKSWKWEMEIWTLEDCARFLNMPDHHFFDIHQVENLMIEKFQPSLNRMHAYYNKDTSDLFDTTDQQQKAHRELFG